MRVTDFLPARRPLRRRGRGVSLPGRCSGPFRPFSTPGGRCCSLTGLGPRTPAPSAHTRRSLAASRLQLVPGALSRRSTSPPSFRRPSTPFGSGLQSSRARPLREPLPQDPARPGHTQTHPHPGSLRRPPPSPGAPPPSPSRASPVRLQLPCRGVQLLVSSFPASGPPSCLARSPFPMLPDTNGGCPST